MAKIRPVRGKKKTKIFDKASAPGIISCLLILILGFGLLFLILYFSFKSA
jgi:hypothetical protein